MKRPKEYIPQYSLSVKYLKMIMTKTEYNKLLVAYVKCKLANWGKYNIC